MKLHNLILLALLIISLSACEKDEKSQNPADDKAKIQMGFQYLFEGEAFNLGKYYSINDSTDVKLAVASYYISQPTILDHSGDPHPLNPAHILVRPTRTSITIGDLEPQHFHRLQYILGLDSITNNSVKPTDFSNPANPLASQPEDMYFGETSGYIFVHLRGEIDYNGDMISDTTFIYELGTDIFRRTKTAMVHTDIAEGDELQLNFRLNVEKIFTDLDLRDELLARSISNPPLALKIQNNFESALEIVKL